MVGIAQITQTYTFDTDTEDWENGSGATVTQDAASYFTAAGSLKLTGAVNKVAKNTTVAVDGMGDYTITYKIRGTAGDRIRTQFKVSGTTTELGDTVLSGGLTGGDGNTNWEEISYTFSLSTAETEIEFQLKIKTADATYYFDDIVITKLDCVGYAVATATVGGGTNVISTPLPCYPEGTEVEFTATPTTHWEFDSWSGDLTGNTNPGSFTVGTADATVTANFVTESGFDYEFLFDTTGDAEGWIPANAAEDVAAGILTFTPNADKFAKLILENFPVPSASYQYLQVTLQNNSTGDNELRVIVNVTENLFVTTVPGSAMTMHEFDLSTLGNWTGDVNDITLRVADAATGQSTGTGDFLIDSIVFSNVSLGISEIDSTSFSMYPNPATDILHINMSETIATIAVFDITGKQVLKVTDITNNQIDISKLNNGIYLVKVEDNNSNYSTQKLVITE